MPLELDLDKIEVEVSSRNVWQTTQTTFNVINHIIILTVAVYMTYVTYSTGNRAISWHVFLCTLGVSLDLFNKKKLNSSMVMYPCILKVSYFLYI